MKPPTPMMAISQKMRCQEPALRSSPPSSGPTMGAPAMIITSVDSICAAWVLPYRSRIMARDSIGPTQAPTAWNTRQNTTSAMVPDSAQPTEPTTKSTMPMKSGMRRPMRSLMGPHSSWAMAKPTRKPVTVSSASPPSVRSIVGSAGR